MPAARKTRPFILVVDQEQTVADTLALVLNLNGFEAMALYSAERLVEAIEVLRPDAIISDVVMHGLSGIDAAIRVQEAIPECKVILLSGQPAAFDLVAAADSDGHKFEFFLKPVHPKVLLDRLKTLMPPDDSAYTQR
jgi:DNA-binding response OmpR family regulator